MKTLNTEGLDSEGFVKICEEIFSAFYKAKTKRSFLFEDGTTDFVILSKNNIAVDCKHPARSPVGRPVIEKFFLAMKKKKVKEGMIVTSGRFASTAQRYVDENDLSITLMDLEKLASVAYKAGIKLVYKKEEPEAFTIIYNSDREFRDNLAKRLKKELKCSEDIGLNISVLKRHVTLVLYFKIDYKVEAEFKVTDKLIHKEIGEGSCYISERTGKIEGKDFARIYDMVPRMAYSPEGDEMEALRPKKKVLDALYDHVQDAHTKFIPYNKKDTTDVKKCAPAKKDITIQNVMCLYLPLSDVEYEVFGKSRTIRSLESSSDEFTIIEPKSFSCGICGGSIAKDGIVCVKCGNFADEKHSAICGRCNTALCTECAFYTIRFLGKKEPICGDCASKEPGIKTKSYR
jgi:hypothetical protein